MAHKSYFFAAGATQKSTLHSPTVTCHFPKKKDKIDFNNNTKSRKRRLLKIIVNDDFLDRTIDTLLKSAATGEVGDGKIFVTDVLESYRIRNAEKGPESLRAKNEE